jgi:hypothetical protein
MMRDISPEAGLGGKGKTQPLSILSFSMENLSLCFLAIAQVRACFLDMY